MSYDVMAGTGLTGPTKQEERGMLTSRAAYILGANF